METFNFPYHTFETTNPESGIRGQFGGNYVFTAPPSDPDQRIFTLHFSVMKFYVNGMGNVDETINPKLNMYALIKFYQAHKLHSSFLYNHPVHGTLICKFQTPLTEPEGIRGGGGAVKEFTVSLIEIP